MGERRDKRAGAIIDFTVYVNVTAPYSNGLGRRTLWRSKTRVEAVSTLKALESDCFQSVGDVYVHGEHQAICILGGGWEIHLNCPDPNSPHCKACGDMQKKANYCRDCCPTPSHADNLRTEELKPRHRRAVDSRPKSGKLKTMNARRKTNPTSRRGKKKLKSPEEVDMKAMMEQLKANFS